MQDRMLYRITTAIIVAVMIFSLFMMYSSQFAPLGFPTYLRTELVVAKVIGLIVLVAPGLSLRVKDAAYTGFAIVLVSAAVAHGVNDSLLRACEPLAFLAVLIASNVYLHRLHRA